ncbi:olfactory receptor class A-like protein 1 [Ambystoma mexicanum]|uniref:olfactory receptor class A-like protein 1 n=1 Tax=Ambystoma mexicanum TaxID=8296 RepID=UPI0037E903C7
MLSSSPGIASIIIYCSALFGTTGNLIILFAFISNAIKRKRIPPLDRIIVNMAFVNLLLCCYKEIPGLLLIFHTRVFEELGCQILLYSYHMLRLVSIWSVENLSLLHLIKIRRPNHPWSKFIHRHQGLYVNWTLAGCWIFSIVLHLPYLQYNNAVDKSNITIVYLTSGNCLGKSANFIIKFITYTSVTMDFILILIVIVLNGFTINLICKHRRQVQSTQTTGSPWNKHSAQATKILLSLLLIYVVCWISSDIIWIAIISGFIQGDMESSLLNATYGILSSIYYSVSACIMVFGYRKVKEYLGEAGCCQQGRKTVAVINIP